MTPTEAETLMTAKLLDVQESADNAAPEDAWSHSILHVMAWDAETAQTVREAYDGLGSTTTSDTIVVLTTTDGWDDWLY